LQSCSCLPCTFIFHQLQPAALLMVALPSATAIVDAASSSTGFLRSLPAVPVSPFYCVDGTFWLPAVFGLDWCCGVHSTG
jgi:hypothetical protein